MDVRTKHVLATDVELPSTAIAGGNMTKFSPQVGSLEIHDTSKTSLTIGAKVNVTNPTEYAATVPFIDINILVNNTILGHATAQNVSIIPGPNHNLPIVAVWDPSTQSGEKGILTGSELLSQYISGLASLPLIPHHFEAKLTPTINHTGYNTTLTLRTHALSIPSQPHLGTALSIFNLTIPTPKLHSPADPNPPSDDENDSAPHFIADAVFHLFTSTATLTLLSPLPHTSLYITSVAATASYNSTPVGSIDYDLPFEVPPGVSITPRLPVDWSLGSVGYDAVKEALGGRLKVEARARVGLRVGRWGVRVWFEGRGIGARVRI